MVNMTARRWWYKPDNTIVGFLDQDGKWFYTTSGQTIGYIDAGWIYTQHGEIIGYFDSHRKNIFSQQGTS